MTSVGVAQTVHTHTTMLSFTRVYMTKTITETSLHNFNLWNNFTENDKLKHRMLLIKQFHRILPQSGFLSLLCCATLHLGEVQKTAFMASILFFLSAFNLLFWKILLLFCSLLYCITCIRRYTHGVSVFELTGLCVFYFLFNHSSPWRYHGLLLVSCELLSSHEYFQWKPIMSVCA